MIFSLFSFIQSLLNVGTANYFGSGEATALVYSSEWGALIYR